MTRTRGIVAALLVVVGLVWVGQGLGIIRGQSLMVDDIRWAWLGGLVALLGVGLAVRARRPRR